MLRSITAANPARTARALTGLRRYQEASRATVTPPRPAIAERHGAALRDYGGAGPDLVVIPSLINPPTVLDLPGKSLLRWLAGNGRRVLLLDWGEASERKALSVAGHIEEIVLPFIEALPKAPDLAGYCLGGTMALAAAQLAEARSLSLIATPWHFSGFGDAQRAELGALWTQAGGLAQQLDVLPMEVLQSAFWSLDPERTVGKYERLAEADEATVAAFVQLEDWANDGPPLPYPAARELLEDFFAADLPGRGEWRVGGQVIDPAKLFCPVLDIVSTTDRIVPAASAAGVGERLELNRGHVGMVVGSKAETELWQPLAAWLSRVSPTC